MTILATNKAYQEAMEILNDRSMAAYRERNDYVMHSLCHAKDHLTNSQRELIHAIQVGVTLEQAPSRQDAPTFNETVYQTWAQELA